MDQGSVGHPRVLELGNFVVGEIPTEKIRYQFLDNEGAPIDISGATCVFMATRVDENGIVSTLNEAANVAGDDSTIAEHTWISADLQQGHYEGRLWADARASLKFVWYVEAV